MTKGFLFLVILTGGKDPRAKRMSAKPTAVLAWPVQVRIAMRTWTGLAGRCFPLVSMTKEG